MTDDDVDPTLAAVLEEPNLSQRARRLRDDATTMEQMVPLRKVEYRISEAMNELRSEWASNIDRAAIERVTRNAEQAAAHAERAATGSRWRFATAMTLMAVLSISLGMQVAYGRANRERIEAMERRIVGLEGMLDQAFVEVPPR